MKFYLIALVSCICLISCGRVSKISCDRTNSKESTTEIVVDNTPNKVDYSYGDNWYCSFLVDTYDRLINLEPHTDRQRHYTSVGFFLLFLA